MSYITETSSSPYIQGIRELIERGLPTHEVCIDLGSVSVRDLTHILQDVLGKRGDYSPAYFAAIPEGDGESLTPSIVEVSDDEDTSPSEVAEQLIEMAKGNGWAGFRSVLIDSPRNTGWVATAGVVDHFGRLALRGEAECVVSIPPKKYVVKTLEEALSPRTRQRLLRLLRDRGGVGNFYTVLLTPQDKFFFMGNQKQVSYLHRETGLFGDSSKVRGRS